MFNEKKFRVIYDEFLGPGLTIRDFCVNQQINEAKFYYWQHKLKDQLPPKRGFVPVVFENGKHLPSKQVPVRNNQEVLHSAFSCEISYPNGVSVKLNGLSDSQMLQSLLVLSRQ
ncbi:MAG: IS66 family insertion sequence element accessory protein TnpB [Prolixibacteraceae bacterium]